jgi:hypothetical protein
MERKTVIRLLIKLFPLYVAILLLWQYAGVSRWYHELIAAVLSQGYALFDSSGPVKGVDVKGAEFMAKLLVAQKKLPLFITAEDITSNTAMLFALYGASPMRGHGRAFASYLFSALGILFLIHLITVAAQIQYALMSNETIMQLFPAGALSLKVIPVYMNFYILIGMYLFILCLWLPYIMTVVMHHRKQQTGN